MDKTERLRRIKRLADNAVGHEKKAAMAAYEKLKTLYNMTDDDVNEIVLHEVVFTYKDKWEKKLLYQCIYSILGNTKIATMRRKVFVKCTAAEEQELSLCYSVYKTALDKHLKESLSAFIMTNNIYPDENVRCGSVVSNEPLTESQIRAMRLASQMEKTVVPRALLNKGD